jgi:hypothetical protein
LQAGNRNHGTVGGLVEAAKMIFFGLGRNQLHFLLKGGIVVYVHSDKAACLLFYDADF